MLSSSDGRATLYRAESPAHLAELLRGEMDRGLRNLALAAEGLVCGQNDEKRILAPRQLGSARSPACG